MKKEIKRKLDIFLCSHTWEIWTVGLNEATSRCKKCDCIRKGKIDWGEVKDPYARIKW